MHLIHLNPTDVLFFRDGRPMEPGSAGYGAAWPLPHVTDAALHAACHRAGEALGDHAHTHRFTPRGGKPQDGRETSGKRFGSLQTSGPFPVDNQSRWFFPTPGDVLVSRKVDPLKHPLEPSIQPETGYWRDYSSLPKPLEFAVCNRIAPGKENQPPDWLSRAAFQAYINGNHDELQAIDMSENSLKNEQFCDTEHSIGIGMDADTGTTAYSQIYSAHYLRLRDSKQWKIGLLASARDKGPNGSEGIDLLEILFPEGKKGDQNAVVVGGQQRVCSVERTPTPNPGACFPIGAKVVKCRVKWVLLTPAIFPSVQPHPERGGNEHPGGWLPNWIDPDDGRVLLKSGNTERQQGESRKVWRERIKNMDSVEAYLKAAVIGKPTAVTGWSLGDPRHPASNRHHGGAKTTLFAVPAGSIYYFEASTPEVAETLGHLLNWHGDTAGTQIRNRRSTLLGEKGYGLGVCGQW